MKIWNMFRRKPMSKNGDRSKADTPYVYSPSAVQYPGVKAEPIVEPAPTPAPVEPIKKDTSALPKCAKCGWSVGFTDSICSNCGFPLWNSR